MTKVKTILKEFCSAKDILAINRLGLLSKDEERESQPIPWRHRLKRRERKELVRSEMRMSLHRPETRLNAKDKARAVSTALSPQHSKMGEHLLHAHSTDYSRLDGRIERITSEKRRSEHEMYHTKRSFLQQSKCLNREPLILVERPPTPNVRTRAAFMNRYGVDPELVTIPSYQRPLLSRARTPSTLTTIDAFTVESRKKRNVWEEAIEEKEEPKFKATAKPSAKLTGHEIRQLKIGHSIHKPTQESIAESKKTVRHTKPRRVESDDDFPPFCPSPSDSGASSPVFLTELTKKQEGKSTKGKVPPVKDRLSRMVADKTATQSSRDPFPPSVPHGFRRKVQSAGANDTRCGGASSGKTTRKPVGKKIPAATKTTNYSKDSKTKTVAQGKKVDFLSVLLEENAI